MTGGEVLGATVCRALQRPKAVQRRSLATGGRRRGDHNSPNLSIRLDCEMQFRRIFPTVVLLRPPRGAQVEKAREEEAGDTRRNAKGENVSSFAKPQDHISKATAVAANTRAKNTFFAIVSSAKTTKFDTFSRTRPKANDPRPHHLLPIRPGLSRQPRDTRGISRREQAKCLSVRVSQSRPITPKSSVQVH